MSDVPQPGTMWRHYNGKQYEVLAIANIASENPRYPVTVIYVGDNGNIWTRDASDWHRSMTLIEDRKCN
ncbi:hypothetical protein [Xanthomonas phage Xp15]|uniref:DUF1653 domain-containing protein n=1 Tax=Xanthomonas phage Xp15 TaxID=322855 RepID=Q52PT9_9CAUD|nr:hypothetical protein XPXV15_gp72 [Xanthomonas phage Xp15]AAX84908.1 hypothetical protein [Xanthomonas phage Xp15]